jgi:hypothetical protein
VPVQHHASELLRIERVAACALEEVGVRSLRCGRFSEQRTEEPGRLLQGQRREPERGDVRAPPSPIGPTVEEVGSGRREHEDRNAAGPVDDVIHEVK